MTAIFLTVLAVALLLPEKWRQKTGPAALSCASLAAFAVLAGGGSMHDAFVSSCAVELPGKVLRWANSYITGQGTMQPNTQVTNVAG